MVFNILSGLFGKKSKEQPMAQTNNIIFENKKMIELLKEQISKNSISVDGHITELTHAINFLDEELKETQDNISKLKNTNTDMSPFTAKLNYMNEKLQILEKNQTDLLIFGKLAIQNHEHEMSLSNRIDILERLMTELNETKLNLTTNSISNLSHISNEQLTKPVNLTNEQLTKPVNLTKLNQNMVKFENDSNEDMVRIKLNHEIEKNGLVKLSSLSKVGLVRFSNETVMLAPQEQQTLFYLYNVQADKKSRATSIKDVVCGLYGLNDQSKTSYISRTMRKLEFMEFVLKKRDGKTTGVWLTKKAVDYCRAALIERFESN